MGARLVKLTNKDIECAQKIHELKCALQQETENKDHLGELLLISRTELNEKEAIVSALTEQQQDLETARNEAKAALDEALFCDHAVL